MGWQSDGLAKRWVGKVWMNHPFGKTTNKPWIAKLASEYQEGNVIEAVCICYASTSERWFLPLLSYPQCFLHGRTGYYLPNGEKKPGATKGSVVTYLGRNVAKFAAEFRSFGTVKVPF